MFESARDALAVGNRLNEKVGGALARDNYKRATAFAIERDALYALAKTLPKHTYAPLRMGPHTKARQGWI